MKLASIHSTQRSSWGVIDGDEAVDTGAVLHGELPGPGRIGRLNMLPSPPEMVTLP